MVSTQGITLNINPTVDNMEKLIFQSLFKMDNVRTTLLPYLNKDIFQNKQSQDLYIKVDKFVNEFNKFPTLKDAFLFTSDNPITNDYLHKCFDQDISDYSSEHLLHHIEKHIKKSLYANAVANMSDDLIDPNFDVSADSSLPEDLRNIFSFSFDTSVGLDVFSDDGFERMMEFFHQVSKYVESGITGLDVMLAGGFHAKSMSLFMLPTNMGKSAIMCALASNMISLGKNVLYVTLEMSEEVIAQRIMANIFDMEQNFMKIASGTQLKLKFQQLKSLIGGRMRVKEFPTSSMNSNVIRRLLKELKEKQGFLPDAIIVDYLELMKPNHKNKTGQKHEELRTVSEELRDIGLEYDLPIISAMQTNRDGYNAKELDLNDMSGSFGVAMTADFVVAGILNSEQEAAKEYLWRCVKNRFGPKYQELTVGIDFAKMKLTDFGHLPSINGEEVKPQLTLPTENPNIENILPSERVELEKKDKFDELLSKTQGIDEINNFNDMVGIDSQLSYSTQTIQNKQTFNFD